MCHKRATLTGHSPWPERPGRPPGGPILWLPPAGGGLVGVATAARPTAAKRPDRRFGTHLRGLADLLRRPFALDSRRLRTVASPDPVFPLRFAGASVEGSFAQWAGCGRPGAKESQRVGSGLAICVRVLGGYFVPSRRAQ